MNPATIALIIQLIPSLVTLTQTIVSDVQQANASGTTEADLQNIISATAALTKSATEALTQAMNAASGVTTTTSPVASGA